MPWVRVRSLAEAERFEEIDLAYRKFWSADRERTAARAELDALLKQHRDDVLSRPEQVDGVTDRGPSSATELLNGLYAVLHRPQGDGGPGVASRIGEPIAGQVPGDEAQLHGHERFPSLVRRQVAAVLDLTVHWLAGWGNRFPLGRGGR